MTPPVPDGPDTELAAANDALSYLDAYARSRDHAHSGDARRWVEAVRAVLARPAAGRDLTDAEDGPTAVELLDALEGMGAALVDIGIALGLPRPSGIEVWGAPEILARIATLNSELKVPPRATARIAQARADQAEGYGSTTSTVEGLLRELDRRAAELLRLRAALARPAVARTDGQCTCGDPSAADLVHHTEAPCRTVEELRTGRTDGQPHPDPRGRYDVPDPYDHPGWPLVSRIVAIATDTAPTMPNETDGVDNAVTGLLADQSWRDHVAMADVMGLVGDWGTDDVVQAVTDALHEYPRLRARVARTDGQPPADPVQITRDPARVTAQVVQAVWDEEGPEGVADWIRDMTAAPADDTAAATAPWMVESRDERVDRLTRHVENVADCAGIEIEVREAGPLTGPAPLRRLVRALEGAGMLHDDPADDTAAPDLVVGKAGVPIDAYDAIQILATRPDHPSRLLAEKARAVADWWNDPPGGLWQREQLDEVAADLGELLGDLLGGGPGDVSDVRPAGQPVRDSQGRES